MPSEQSSPTEYDVVVVGYGPTGMVLAPLLAQRGYSVAVLERYAGLYNLPRAATCDDETMRIFQKLGIGEVVSGGTRPVFVYDWTNGEGEVLARHTFAESGLSGWPEFNMFYQPWLEDRLDELSRSLPGVDVRSEHRVVGLRQDEDGVTLDVETPSGPTTVSARYVVASDGGNSTVRELLGVGSQDYGFREPWLVCDFRLTRAVEGLPSALQLGDPAQPVSIFRIDDEHQRFAFMLDDAAQLDDITEADVWRMVSRWLTPQDAEPIRIATYTFRSRCADRWRTGRVFLAGDAAHEMPPFLGQGMCSGIRDANNLAWKLDEVLAGRADDALLDTYQAERAPHVQRITRKAIELGRLQTIRDVDQARARDERMRAVRAGSGAPAAYAFPGYDAGFLVPGSGDGTGLLFPQGRVRAADGVLSRFDDVVGPGFHVVTTDRATVAGVGALPDAVTDVVLLVENVTAAGDATAPGAGVTVLADVDGVARRWFDDHGAAAVVVRPDGYVFAAARGADELSRAVAKLARTVAAAGTQPLARVAG